jgi:hypothetical protein
MEYNDSECMGCLLFDDVTFCRQIYHLLKGFYRHSILEIGELEISHARTDRNFERVQGYSMQDRQAQEIINTMRSCQVEHNKINRRASTVPSEKHPAVGRSGAAHSHCAFLTRTFASPSFKDLPQQGVGISPLPEAANKASASSLVYEGIGRQ